MIREHKNTFIRIAFILGMVVLLALLLLIKEPIGVTFATGSGTGGLELKIDSTTFYNGVKQEALSWNLKNLVPGVDKFFNFDDVKPGDTGTSSISVHLKKNPAWVCLDFRNLRDDENGENEPEALIDNGAGGELSKELEFFAWRDDGDRKFEVGEKPLFGAEVQTADPVIKNKTYALADSAHLPAYQPNQTKYVGVVWCAGDLLVDTATAKFSCNGGAMGNEAQTDSMSVDVIIRAVAVDGNRNFRCTSERPQDPCKDVKGNNGHGNDNDRNDDSNPGTSNDPEDDTDDDGLPPGFAKKTGGDTSGENEGCPPKGNNGHGNDNDHNDDSNPGTSNDPEDDTGDDGLPPGQVLGERGGNSWSIVNPKSFKERAGSTLMTVKNLRKNIRL